MATIKLYYATNRRHRGSDQWRPSSYGGEPSKTGAENLRFGQVTMAYEVERAQAALTQDVGFGSGDGISLAKYLRSRRRHARIDAFPERLKVDQSDNDPTAKLGSQRAFKALQQAMNKGCDTLVFIHGYNVDWWDAVASAASLQLMLNRAHANKPLQVLLYTWPSDGRQIPYWSYYSDRSDAEHAGPAMGRGFLKLRDYLINARREARRNHEPHCRQGIHLLCHSMGNTVLQSALKRTEAFSVSGKPPRIFDHIFLCAADVNDDVFDAGNPFRRLPEMAETVTIFHNKGDVAMPVSDHTKGNSDRLGWRGVSRPAELDARVHQVDCSDVIPGLVEHAYYQQGVVNDDIRQSIDGITPDAPSRLREPKRHGWPNVWRLKEPL